MGSQMHGWVEVKPNWYFSEDSEWQGIIYLDPMLFIRDYDMFYVFFGIEGHLNTNLQPVAGLRGLPDDVSSNALEHSDWPPDDGDSHSWISYHEISNVKWQWRERENGAAYRCIEQDGYVYEILPSSDMLFQLMETLATHHGPQNVRLVVWFSA